jgi:hypothetical protein
MEAYSLGIGRRIGDNDLSIAAAARVTGARLLRTDEDFNFGSKSPTFRRLALSPAADPSAKSP